MNCSEAEFKGKHRQLTIPKPKEKFYVNFPFESFLWPQF